MKGEAIATLRCSGTTRFEAHCRGHARYRCACGQHWCGTHVVRSGSDLRCRACGKTVTTSQTWTAPGP